MHQSIKSQIDLIHTPGKKDGGRLTRFLQEAVNKGLIKPITGDLIVDSHLAYHGIEAVTCGHCGASFIPRKQFKHVTSPIDYGCSKNCTTMLRHGFISPFELATTQEKKQQTVLERYGATNVFQVDAVKQTIKSTIQNRFGVDSAMQAPAVKAKAVKTYRDKYGTDWVFSKNSPVRHRIEDTWQQRWGVAHPPGHPDVVARANETRIQRYGAANQGATVEAKQKALITKRTDALKRMDEMLAKHGYQLIDNNLLVDDLISNGAADALLLHTCGATSLLKITCAGNVLTTCKHCVPMSRPEQELYEYVLTLTSNVFRHDRKLLKPLEVDMFLPEHRLAIELNGVYWHKDTIGHDGATMYHMNKTDRAAKQDIQLMHIFDHEWNSQQEIIKSLLATRLGHAKRVGARELKLVEVDRNEAIDFFEANHLQGFINGQHIGLRAKDGVLLMAMTVGGKRFSRHGELEIYRQATKQGVIVLGGLARLLTQLRKLHAGRKLITFVDRRFFTGKSYLRAGFKLIHISSPNYWYYKNGQLINRLAATMQKLPALLGDAFSSDLTEQENMELNGWYKLSDSGNLKLELIL
jgi:hypothetical protein